MYHLVFSSYIWDIGGGQQSFRLDDYSYARWLGFPKALNFMQGAFWYLTGSINSIVLPQIITTIMYFHVAKKIYKIPLALSILLFFSCPLLLLHYVATYIDLLSGEIITLSFILLIRALDLARQEHRPFPLKEVIYAGIALTIAGNAKYQAWLATSAILAIVTVNLFFLADIPRRSRMALGAFVILFACTSSGSLTVNTFKFGNPFYPIEVRIGPSVLFSGPETLYDNYPGYQFFGGETKPTHRLPTPVNFMLSATEFDWTMRGVAGWYNVDSNAGDTPRRGRPARTGGFGGWFFLLNISLLALQWVNIRRARDRFQKLNVVDFTALLIITSIFPQSHELRYWLYIPLIMTPINLRFALQRKEIRQVLKPSLYFLVAYGVIVVFLSPKSDIQPLYFESEQRRRLQIPSDVMNALTLQGRYCNTHDPLLFRFSTAATGVSGLLSQRDEDCHPPVTMPPSPYR